MKPVELTHEMNFSCFRKILMTLDPSIDAQVAVLLERYNTWRNLCEMVGAATPDEPTLENDHLAFRYGYPNDGWTGYTLNH